MILTRYIDYKKKNKIYYKYKNEQGIRISTKSFQDSTIINNIDKIICVKSKKDVLDEVLDMYNNKIEYRAYKHEQGYYSFFLGYKHIKLDKVKELLKNNIIKYFVNNNKEDITEEVIEYLNRSPKKREYRTKYNKKRYSIGEKINLFDNIYKPTLSKFNRLFKCDVKGNKDSIVKIGEPYKNNGRILYIDNKKHIFMFERLYTDKTIDQMNYLKDKREGNSLRDSDFRQLNHSKNRVYSKRLG